MNHLAWGRFFVDFEPFEIVLGLDRPKLPKPIPNSKAPFGEGVFIPYVEVWYPGPVRVTALLSKFLTFENRQEHRIEIIEDGRFCR